MSSTDSGQDPPAVDAVTVVAVVSALVAVCAGYLLVVGRAVAVWLAGAGWAWPQGSSGVWSSVGGILSGRPLDGLGAASATGSPPGWVIYLVIALVEAAWLGAAGAVTHWWWVRFGPGCPRGMASPGQVEDVLGVSRLRRVRAVIRPDLWARDRPRPRAGARR